MCFAFFCTLFCDAQSPSVIKNVVNERSYWIIEIMALILVQRVASRLLNDAHYNQQRPMSVLLVLLL